MCYFNAIRKMKSKSISITETFFKLLVFLLIGLYSSPLTAQEVEYSLKDHFMKLPDSVNCIMLGELHNREFNVSNQIEIIRTVSEYKGVRHVFLELPRTHQLEIDLYLNDKIEQPLSFQGYRWKDYILGMLAGFKIAFSTEIKSGKLAFHCFDMEEDEEIIKRFSNAIQYVQDQRLDELRSMLLVNPFTVEGNIKQGKEILMKLESNEKLYSDIFGKYYPSLVLGLKENIQVQSRADFKNTYEDAEIRENSMDSTIRSIVDFQTEKVIVLTGVNHVFQMGSEAFSAADPRNLPSLYERLEVDEEIHLVRYNFLYMPARFPGRLFFHSLEKYLDRKKWMALLKDKKYLICNIDQVTEEECSDLCDYFIMNNIKR